MKIYAYKGKSNLCGERIRLARAKNRITQSDLAARMQVAGIMLERDSISRIEIGTRFVTDYELKVFAEVLGVSMDDRGRNTVVICYGVFSLEKYRKNLTIYRKRYIIKT